jgi:hypothetical protein
MTEPERRYRPTTPLCLPLQTGNGFAMSLFMWGFFWMPALAVAATGVLSLVLGHWILGPILALTGAFFMGAFSSFPREVWVARPCDLQLDAHGFRVIGGHHAGVSLSWEELDAKASGLRDGAALLSRELVAVTRDGRRVPVAEGEERASFEAVLNAWRASAGLEPTPEQSGGRKKKRGASEQSAQPQAVKLELISCGRCGAAACPQDAATAPCLYCGEAVPMLEGLRRRLRDVSSHAALKARSHKMLERVLKQPRAPITMALLGLLAAGMLGAWLFGGVVFARALLAARLDLQLVLLTLAAPLLITLSLTSLASVVAARRVALRAVAVDFAAIAPPAPGKPCSCRVCGAPLPQLDLPVVPCAYCTSFNVVSCARPRAASRVQDQIRTLEETLESQSAEQIVRYIFVAVIGLPALWAALFALRALWLRLG